MNLIGSPYRQFWLDATEMHVDWCWSSWVIQWKKKQHSNRINGGREIRQKVMDRN